MTPTPTPQQIIELAREAGFVLGFSSPALEKHMRFATLLLERYGQAPAVQQEPVATKRETQQFNCFHVSAEDFQRLKALPVGAKLYHGAFANHGTTRRAA